MIDMLGSTFYTTDPAYLIDEQYHDTSNYKKRLAIFAYGDNDHVLDWLAQEYIGEYSLNGKKILEIGVGTGEFWEYYAQRCQPQGIELEATDLSLGMLEASKEFIQNLRLEEGEISATFQQVSIDGLSQYADQTFDAVIAHNVIYHAKHPVEALKEMKRILKPNGLLGLSLVEEDSHQTLWEAANQCDERVPKKGFTSVFCEKQAGPVLLSLFEHVRTRSYANNLWYTDSSVPVESIRTSPTVRALQLSSEFYDKLKQKIDADIDERHGFASTYTARHYLCRKS